ncbi:DUF2459 domain-containing protein [Nisaea nitritireducens]|uniref:DUF2459 domain-containing protein n=1 Tax=Nisaea nitritireducens TaxID=568392 RepID=UPI001867EE2A|nr:DUF2459 domain-containing protein [Nisaea nitritireducens]
MRRGGARCRGLLTGVCLLFAILAGGRAAAAADVAVINIGWHTGIALRVTDIDPVRIPETEAFAGLMWIEFGWGDRDFYQDPDPDLSDYFSAVFLNTPAIMHLVGIPVSPQDYFPSSEVVVFPVTDAEHARLQKFIAGSFKRPEGGRAPAIARGLYPASLFYDAIGSFSLTNTCNSWVARGLADAGLIESAEGIVTAGGVMTALRSALADRRSVVER